MTRVHSESRSTRPSARPRGRCLALRSSVVHEPHTFGQIVVIDAGPVRLDVVARGRGRAAVHLHAIVHFETTALDNHQQSNDRRSGPPWAIRWVRGRGVCSRRRHRREHIAVTTQRLQQQGRTIAALRASGPRSFFRFTGRCGAGLGKRVVRPMLSAWSTRAVQRSSPMAKPPCGGMPWRKVCR